MTRFQGGGGSGFGPRPGREGWRRGGHGQPESAERSQPVFDPSKPLADLLDKLAEEQANSIVAGRDKLNSSQLRRFFGDVKSLYRRWQQGADYKTAIEPEFKMLRSKASYACRPGDRQRIPVEFCDFISEGVKKVATEEQFKAFVQHFEAVVGFLYGSGKVGKS
jgi:CRISPR-associated protein Csm2